MNVRIVVLCLTLCCLAVASLAGGALAEAPSAGQATAKAATQPASPSQDASELAERVQALEKENVVLREDLGKARLDARTQLSDAAKQRAEMERRLRDRIDELNGQLAAESDRQARRNKNLWIAIGVVALGVIAAN